jgi:hypothetical protein
MAIIFGYKQYVGIHSLPKANVTLSVLLTNRQNHYITTQAIEKSAALTAQDTASKTAGISKPLNHEALKSKPTAPPLASDQAPASRVDLDSSKTKNTAFNPADYFGPNDVERKALPLSNIDRSMLAQHLYSGLPIKLRLYINATGHIVKIERIAVLEQDAIFVDTLEKLLFDLTFLPAKRDGLDVNSYLDIAFSFGD